MRKRILISCFLLSFSAARAQESRDLQITRTSSSRIVVQFAPNYYPELTSDGDPSIGFVGGIAQPGPPGSPLLPYRALSIILNGPSASVRILDSEFTERNDVQPRAYPHYTGDPDFGPVMQPRPLQNQGRGGFVPTTIAEVVDVAMSAEGFRGTLRIFPVQFDETKGIVRQYRRIVVEVQSDASLTPARRTAHRSDSPLQQGPWYRIPVRETGVYKLDESFFASAGISLGSLSDIKSIRIFGNGGKPRPENLSAPGPDGLMEITRHVVDQNGNGEFDSGDFVLFFGSSPRGWAYNSFTRSFNHFINPYTEENAYFLTFGGSLGRDMDSLVSSNGPSPFIPNDVLGMMFTEEEQNNLLKSGREWYGQRFDSESPTGSYATTLPGLNPSMPVTYKVTVLGRTGITESFLVEESGESLGSITIGPVALGPTAIQGNYAYKAPVTTFSRSGSLPENRSLLRFTFQTTSGVGWLDWFEIFYRRNPEAVNDVLMFPSPDTSALVEYRLSGFSSRQVEIFDVSRHDSVIRVGDLQFDALDPGKCTFQLPQVAGSVRMLLAVGAQGFRIPGGVGQVENSNVTGITAGADFVILTPREFRTEAERLQQHREQRDSLSVVVINVEDILNEYGGLPDPMAIRDFVDQAASWVTPPRYVLLLGDGHYDYKNIRTEERNWILPYESAESIHQIATFASDDQFALLNAGNPRVSLAMGRLPVNSVQQAQVAVEKIIAYETTAPFGPWRNQVTYVADDGLTSVSDDRNLHTFQAEVLSQSFTPPQANKKKIYIIEYPTVNSSSGRRKPTANNAIVDAMNDGTLVLNYTGHGNPQLWAHEAVFTREGSLPLLANRDKLFLLVAATCDYARYDDPSEVSAGELILTMEQGGAIGVVTASRAVYSSDNFQFNNTFYTELFRREQDGRPSRLGDALYRTKQIHYSLNDLKYHLLGDPTMRLNLPWYAAGVDSMNGASLSAVVPVQALEKISMTGEVRRQDGSRWTDFTGRALLEMYDARRQVIVPEWNNYAFEVNGSLLYRGEISVTDGLYRATLPVPKDVSYDNNRARVSVYAWTALTDASGYTENVIIAGTDSSAAQDTTGPAIMIFLEDESFRSGDVVPPDAELIVKLFDENGVNTSTASVGHRLEAVLSNTGESLTLNNYYRGDLDTYQSGEARYRLQSLPEGRQTLEVTAWDTYNNSAREQIEFEVRAASDLEMYNVFNLPNPVSRSTVFTFQRTTTNPIDVEVKVYSTAGRLLKVLQATSIVDRFVQMPWDGRDQNGDPIANGVYFYKIIARSLSGTESKEVIGKLAILR